MYGRFGAEDRDIKEIITDCHVYFTPQSDSYNKRVYDGIEVKVIDNISFVKNKGIDWQQIKIEDGE